ncbi:hypothetical protein C1752_00447 [Acaryochloris thomasi RCC1774]|uniref:Uncharacterized protein n=1 Tax=Acaryochloris thomasi RCC1774 TaxID=1764569 RepID=A0A2W1JPD0_9CYAN|nr:DUF4922 domain-containing protein [Acaryochloris thomasi]PZD75208.1 hypothetical protein C1752_00447 [Acaryochloris thomasi RCC1774]
MTSAESERRSSTLVPGRLWNQIVYRTQQAITCGALQSISTTTERIEQQGLNFIVRVSDNIARKVSVAKKSKNKRNPFLPYEEELFVADVSSTHVALLNKFNVVDHHLLIITRHFEPQESWLTLPDFKALASCLAEVDGLAFYNGGRTAGASQGHKHLQIVPLPLIENDIFATPLEALTMTPSITQGMLELPFLHGIAPLSVDWTASSQAVATELIQSYRSLYEAAELSAEDHPQPYSLLVTRRWMLLVPRSQESHAHISVNALGFAGSLFVRDYDQLERLKQIGPMSLLQKVTYPR